jgi:hypothetical protein
MSQSPQPRRFTESARPAEDPLGKGELLPRYVFLEPLIAERRVLEVGLVAATRGAGARFLASRSARSVVALDPDPEAVAQAAQEPVAGVSFLCGGLADVPDRGFDLVIGTLERSLEKAGGFLEKLSQKLSPSGYLCLALRNPAGVTLAQVARGEEREAPPSCGELAKALGARFASVEVVSQTVLLGYHVGPHGTDGAPTLDPSLAGTQEPAYYLLIASSEPSHLGESVLVTLPPAPIAVASSAREELREGLRQGERRAAELLNERAELDVILHARLTELGEMRARLLSAEGRERLSREQVDSAEGRVAQAEAVARAAKDDALQLDRALTDALRQLELDRAASAARSSETTDAHREREVAQANLRRAEVDRDALATERDRLVREAAVLAVQQEQLQTDVASASAALAGREDALNTLRQAAQQAQAQLDRTVTELAASRRETQDAIAERAQMSGQLEHERTVNQQELALTQARTAALAQNLELAQEKTALLEAALADGAAERLTWKSEQERLQGEQASLQEALSASAAQLLALSAGLQEAEASAQREQVAAQTRAAELTQISMDREAERAAFNAERTRLQDGLEKASDATLQQTAALSDLSARHGELEQVLSRTREALQAKRVEAEAHQQAATEAMEQQRELHARELAALAGEHAAHTQAHLERTSELEQARAAERAHNEELLRARDEDRTRARDAIAALEAQLAESSEAQAQHHQRSAQREAEQQDAFRLREEALHAEHRAALALQTTQAEEALQHQVARAAQELESHRASEENQHAQSQQELEALRAEHRAALENQHSQSQQELEALRAEHRAAQENQHSQSQQELEALRAAHEDQHSQSQQELEALRAAHAHQRSESQQELEALRAEHRAAQENQHSQSQQELEALRAEHRAAQENQHSQSQQELEALRAAHEDQHSQSQQELEALRATHRGDLDALRTQSELALHAAQTALQSGGQDLEQRQLELAEVRARSQALQLQLDEERTARAALSRSKDELERIGRVQQAQLDELEQELQQAFAARTALQDEQAASQAAVRSMEQGAGALHTELEEARAHQLALTERLGLLEAAHAESEAVGLQWKAHAEAVDAERARLEELHAQAATQAATLPELQAQLLALQEQTQKFEALQGEHGVLRGSLNAARASLETRSRELADARTQLAQVGPEQSMKLQAAEVRAGSLQTDRERLLRELEELGEVQRSTERERLRFEALAKQTDALRAELEQSRKDQAELQARGDDAREALADARIALEAEQRRFDEALAQAVDRSTGEAKLLRALSERQEAELKTLRVNWARASAELSRLETAHVQLGHSETTVRNELATLKSGSGILAASDLVEAMGLEPAKVKRLEARIKELEERLKP